GRQELVERGLERPVPVDEALVAPWQKERSELERALASAARVTEAVRHRDDAAAVPPGGSARLRLVLARVDEGQRRDLVRRRHARDEPVEAPLAAEARRAGQVRGDEEDAQRTVGPPGGLGARFARARGDAEAHRGIDPGGQRSTSDLGLVRAERASRAEEG